jgi:processive 1,2-diacylglycerol beta-glucosyltransferase
MTDRILILSASAGAGHLRAAEALELALRQLAPNAMVRNVDVLSLATKTFNRLYGQAYLDFVNRAPHVLGYFYDLLDQPRRKNSRTDKLRLIVEKLNLRPFLDLLRSEPWDLIVNTHFLPAEIIASLRRRRRLTIRHVTVTTDFETHRLWVHKPCEHYFVATGEGAAYLESWGIPKQDITVMGIPIHPVFSRERPRSEYLDSQGLEGDRPVLLQLAGGFGVGPIEKIYQALLDLEVPVEIVVASGRNKTVGKKLSKIKVPRRHLTKILGFTNEIDELMGAADIVVSKPGGLTVSETLARGAAMAVVNPIPGQEARNSDFLLENGAAIKINNVATLQFKLTELLEDTGRLARLKANAKRLGRPRAAFDIGAKAIEMARQGGPATPGRH